MDGAFADPRGIRRPRKAKASAGLELSQGADGLYELALSDPLGSGVMRGRAVSRNLFAATVDFACKRCPNIPVDPAGQPQSFPREGWLTVNLCEEGRCEVDVPGEGLAVVAAGDLCISCSRERPAEFRYPSGRYRGVELFVNTRIAEEAPYSLLGADGIGTIARRAGYAAVLTNDAEANGHMERIASLLDPPDSAMAEYEALGLLLCLQRRDLSAARPRFMLTRAQMTIAESARDEMERALDLPHDARKMAAGFGVSASTLNEYFSRAYGRTVAGYLRQRRMEAAAELLAQGSNVADAASRVGYANPSKFAAAFKRAFGTAPREWRRMPRDLA